MKAVRRVAPFLFFAAALAAVLGGYLLLSDKEDAAATHEMTDENAESVRDEILQSQGAFLIVACTDRRAACRLQMPIVQAIAAGRASDLKVYVIDIDSAPATARKHGISSMAPVPMFVVVRAGTVVMHFVGYLDEDELTAILDHALSDAHTHRQGDEP